MRQDIREGVVWYIMHNIEPNFSAMSRQFNCDYRTVKAAYLERINQSNEGPTKPKTSRPSLLDLFKPKIDEKLDIQCSAKSIYKLIKKQGYKGSYSTVKQYCQKQKKEKNQSDHSCRTYTRTRRPIHLSLFASLMIEYVAKSRFI